MAEALSGGTGRLQLPELPVLLIPAYQPASSTLIPLVRTLAQADQFAAIVLIDDGSGADLRWIFDELSLLDGVRIVRHAVNLGKGAALKSGINFALVEYPECAGVITADADGQHHPEDIRRVAEAFSAAPAALLLGARSFTGEVPLRSRAGNLLTRQAMRLLVGQKLSDTQTGLRAVPRALAERLLRVPASGYEFELEMLITCRQMSLPVAELPIQTIYEAGNPSSHFQPLRDSMRIYFVLLRYSMISLLSASVDNVAFYLIFHATGVVGLALVSARALAMVLNYLLVRRAVFHSNQPHRVVLPRYLMLGAASGAVSYSLIGLLTHLLPVAVMPAKMIAETLLFIAGFAIQRDFVFARRGAPGATPA